MYGKLLGGCAALCLVSTPTSTASTVTVNYPQVKKVQCASGSGTGFLTEQGWISVEHVTRIGGCEVDGHPIVAEPEKGLDFARFKVSLSGPHPLKINCDGFKTFHWYFAIGFAGGFPWQTMTRHFASFTNNVQGLRVLLDTPTVIPGMSGGPILDEDGAVVGVVNAYNGFYGTSYSRALKDTSLCRKSA